MSIKKKTIFQGALILSSAGVITRLLGFVYRIYITNAIGAEGVGLYQLIMPLYSLAWSIACSGITTSVSKLVARENAKKEYGNMGMALKQALVISCSTACLLTIVMFGGARYIAVYVFRDARTIMPIQILSAALPFMAAGSAIRGYFIGLSQPETPAISQVIEQLVRMTVIWMIAGSMMPLGLEYACSAAVIGIVAEEFISFLYMLYSYRKFKLKHSLNKRPTLSTKQTLAALTAMALPLTLNRVSGSLLATVENALIPQRLEAFGMTRKEAISAFGRITGMAMPLIFFPSALLTALSITLVPAITESATLKNQERISHTISKSIMFTALLGIGAAGIFLTLPNELGKVIYNQDISEMLFLMGLMCPLWYINITLSGILNGLGEQVFIFKHSLLSSTINIAFIYFLVPSFGINAFLLGWFVSMLIVTIFSVLKIKKTAEIKLKIGDWFVKPTIASAASSLTVGFLARKILLPTIGGIAGLAAAVCLIIGIYMVFIIILGCVKIGDIKAIFSTRQ